MPISASQAGKAKRRTKTVQRMRYSLTREERERINQRLGVDEKHKGLRPMITMAIKAAEAKRNLLAAAKAGYDFGPTEEDIATMKESYS